MGKLLVSCDEYAYLYNGKYYLRAFGHTLVNRYLDVFENIRFSVRTKAVEIKEDLGIYNIPVTDKRIEIYPIPFFRGPKEYATKYWAIKKVIYNSTKGCSWAIIRVPSTIGFAVLNIIRAKKIPHCLEVVANPSDFINAKNTLLRILMHIMHFQQLKACRHANGVSYVTEYTLQKKYPIVRKEQFEAHYSSVHLSDSFFGSIRKYPKKNPFIICHVANPITTLTKGHKIVIKVVKHLTDNGYDVVAKFAGNGEFIKIFQQFATELGIAEKIEFVGLLNQERLKSFLDNADIMLFPSESEGLPRALIEAMATGLPCLSTNIGGIPELLPADLLYQPHDSQGFATKIAQIIDNSEEYVFLSSMSLRKSTEYKSELLQRRRIDFYKKLKTA